MGAVRTLGLLQIVANDADRAVTLAPDWQRAQLKVVAFVQERRGRAILASAVLPVDRR
jgi:hypothetical protein